MRALLVRLLRMDAQTIGDLILYSGTRRVGRWRTLELPDAGNAPNVSRIPAGTYNAVPYDSPSHGRVYLLEGVPGRSWIEIHAGNYARDTRGCILIGRGLSDIDGDGLVDVTDSRRALSELFAATGGADVLLAVIDDLEVGNA